MQIKQHTIQSPVTFTGIGIHSDCTANVTCLPAAPDHGIKFQRTDVEGQPIVEAIVDHVVDVTRSTTLRRDTAYVDTVEHLLSALSGLELDNMLIQIDAPEIPILDGSAAPFVNAFQEVGLVNQGVSRRFFQVNESVVYCTENKDTELSAFPLDDYKLSVMIGFENNALGNQHAYLGNISDYPQEIAPNRTFAFLSEIQSLYEHGLIRGGNVNNALVIVDKEISSQELENLSKLFHKKGVNLTIENGILNNVKLNFSNEPARHKLLDLVGDLSLLGRPIKGHIVAHKPGHAANIAFVRKLRKLMLQQESVTIPTYDPTIDPVLDIKSVTKMLPHRYPFQLVDKIIHLDKRTVTGIKNVTINEPFFQGHFPDNPIMPGVLQIEAIVQTGGVLVLSGVPDPENYATYFLAIEQCRFRKMVVPGDTFIMHCELLTEIKRGIVKMRGRGFVGNKLACEAIMTAQIVKPIE
jgi:UDP-3-O-[3-hydroxymyristoyl] N-acetylglucosamine deacetylase / 3-hydroxyacyl-[acyl-carrier-protein] dehydratase